MPNARSLPWLLVPVLCVSACNRAADGAGSSADKAPARGDGAPPAFAFVPDRADLLFTYVDARGNVVSVDKAEDVPADRRDNVMVVDLARSPEERQADRYVYFADLSVKDPEGRHVANVVSRYRPAAATGTGPVEVFAADAQKGDVLVYSAEWCDYCKKTMAFLKQKGVPYRERDVEKDSGAEAELQQKARRAGVKVSGVPVTDFMGELVMGFDQAKLDSLVKKRARAAAPPPDATE